MIYIYTWICTMCITLQLFHDWIQESLNWRGKIDRYGGCTWKETFYMHIYVCACVCMCVCVYTRTHARKHKHTHISSYINENIHVFFSRCRLISSKVCMYICIHTYTTYMNGCAHHAFLSLNLDVCWYHPKYQIRFFLMNAHLVLGARRRVYL